MSKKRLRVTSRHGEYNFQTGMITASLLQRGVPMEQAFRLARALRQRLAGRERISTDELRVELNELVKLELGTAWNEEREHTEPAAVVVVGPTGERPFSRSALLRQMSAVGVSTDDALALLPQVLSWLIQRGRRTISEDDLDAGLARMLKKMSGKRYARRFRLVRWLAREKEPVIIFIGGSTGTGKSTLATELSFRLGIRRVTGTDMIRETLRSVLSSELVPGLHAHSFRGMRFGGSVLSDPRERVLAGFRQQAEQVSVGIRAVVARAIREGHSLVVEGTHLLPPFEQYVPEGALTAGLVMAVPDQAEHLARFPRRAQRTERTAQPYLNSFQSVRWIHDHLLSLAEEEDLLVLARGDRDALAEAALSYLSQALPLESVSVRPPPKQRGPRSLMLILDGLGDERHPDLKGQTPLEAAHTPVLDRMAGNGIQGLAVANWGDTHPNTSDAMALLLGMDARPGNIGRGLLEAMGSGVPIPRPSVVLRGNLATAQPDGLILDRRAGRIRETAPLLGQLVRVPLPGGVRGSIFPGHEHRVTVVLHGPDLSASVTNTDPGNRAAVWKVRRAQPKDDSNAAERTARALNALLDLAAQHLASHAVNLERERLGLPAANRVITRGAAHTDDIEVVSSDGGGALVAGCRTCLGVARLRGMQVATSPRMTGSLDTDLDAKFAAADKLLAGLDSVVVHIKGTDVAAHDKRPEAKRDFIEAIDAALGRFLAEQPDGTRVLVTADHGTSSVTGVHLEEPVPVLLGTWRKDEDETGRFTEATAQHGALGEVRSNELLDLLSEA